MDQIKEASEQLENELNQDQETEEGQDGGTDSGAAAADDKGAAPAAGKEAKTEDDPEYEIDGADDAGKPVKQKVKLSELKKGYLRETDYTKKNQELSKVRSRLKDIEAFVTGVNQHDGLRKLIHTIVVKSGMDSGSVNDEVVNKYLGLLEEKVEQKQDDLDAEQKEIGALLSELDPESAHYKALKRQSQENKLLQKKLAEIEKKISGVDEFKKGLTEKEQQTALAKATTEASEVFKTTLDELSNADKGGYKFVHDMEKQRWAGTVQNILAQIKWPDDTTLEMFKATVQKAGKAAWDYITKEREAYQAAYLKKEEPTKPLLKKKTEGKEQIDTSDLDKDSKELLENLI